MRWLVTFSNVVAKDKWMRLLEELSCEVEEGVEPIPLDHEFVIEVDGPSDLPKRCKKQPKVSAVYPSSEMSLY